MAKIFISYSRKDRDYVLEVVRVLKEHGHEITVDVDALSPGQNWQQTLADGLKTSEIFVVFLSRNSLNSNNVISEIGSARAYANQSDQMLVVPVIIDDINLPTVVQDILAIDAVDRDVSAIVAQIDRAIADFFGRKIAKDEAQVEISRRIESNAATYVQEAISMLIKLEARNRMFGVIWYIAGFLALVCGIVFAGLGFTGVLAAAEKEWLHFGVLIFKSLIIIGLLGACSKYAFALGKSYISESLKSADRIHAISFGKFYLQAYGTKATWPELKEVFQHWNIDRTSTFASLATAEFDPKLLESAVEIAKSLSARANDKK